MLDLEVLDLEGADLEDVELKDVLYPMCRHYSKPSAKLCINWSIALNIPFPLTDLLLGSKLITMNYMSVCNWDTVTHHTSSPMDLSNSSVA